MSCLSWFARQIWEMNLFILRLSRGERLCHWVWCLLFVQGIVYKKCFWLFTVTQLQSIIPWKMARKNLANQCVCKRVWNLSPNVHSLWPDEYYEELWNSWISREHLQVRSCAGCRLVLHTQTAVMDLNGVSSAAQAPLGRSGIELQLLSIIIPTTALQRGQNRKCILHPVGSWEEQLPYTVCSQDG